jgi:redox-sensitive bicupin YhaK (pirin superfamily)
MSAPAYQEFAAGSIPVEPREGGVSVKVIAGRTARGLTGPVKNPEVEPIYFDVTVPSGAAFEEVLPKDHNAMVVVFEGALDLAGRRVDATSAAFLGEGERLQAKGVDDRDARFLVIAGQPIGEPVAWAGPFVMNTREEVMQAFEDFQQGRF